MWFDYIQAEISTHLFSLYMLSGFVHLTMRTSLGNPGSSIYMYACKLQDKYVGGNRYQGNRQAHPKSNGPSLGSLK